MRIGLPLLCALVSALEAKAQAAPAPRPRLGLVLSGGGARGSAHVGVLQVLEELHVPVTCIAGTSMGAIVGGLYAYGLSPSQLEQLVTRQGRDRDWDALLRDGEPYRDWPFRRKEEGHTYLARARLGVRGTTVRLPKGIVQGQNLETELRFLTLEAHDLASFDRLPIPFRCTGVDIHTGEQVVLDHGNLADALRASMSLPGVFAPAVVEGRELLDGGLANNVPIDVARAMGADALIVVDIGTPIDEQKEIADLIAVTQQMVAILTQQNVDRSLASLRPGDLLIQPDLRDITSKSFDRAAEAVAIGRAAALKAAPLLRRWSVTALEYEQFLATQRRQPKPLPKVRAVQIVNDSALADGLIQARLHVEPGQVLGETELRLDIDRLFAIDDFQRVRFSVHDWRDDAADVQLATELKGWGPSFVQFGMSLQSDFDRTSYQLAALLVVRELDGLGAEWRNAIEVGQRQTIASEIYQPLSCAGPWFVAPRAVLRRESVDLYSSGDLIAEQDLRSGELGVDVGMELDGPGELRLGYQRTSGQTDIGLASQPIPDTEFDDGFARALLRVDTLDAPFFAQRGVLAGGEFRWAREELGADADYQSLRLLGRLPCTFGAWTLMPLVEWNTTLAGTRPIDSEATLGGFARLSGLPQNSLRGQQAAIGTLVARAHLVDSVVPLYGGGTVEFGNVWQRRQDEFRDLIAAGSLFIAMDLPIGPFYFGVGVAEGGEVTGFLNLGPYF